MMTRRYAVVLVASTLSASGAAGAAELQPCVQASTSQVSYPAHGDLTTLSGGRLASAIRNAVVTNPQGLDALAEQLRGMPSDRAGSMGAGLGEAANICQRDHGDVAAKIQEVVIRLNIAALTDTFETVSGDLKTTSVGQGQGSDEPAYSNGDVSYGQQTVTRRRDDNPGLGGTLTATPNLFSTNFVPFGISVSRGGSDDVVVIVNSVSPSR